MPCLAMIRVSFDSVIEGVVSFILTPYIAIVAGLLVNLIFLSRFFADYGGADGTSDNIDPSITVFLWHIFRSQLLWVPLLPTEIATLYYCSLIVNFSFYYLIPKSLIFILFFISFILLKTPYWLAYNGILIAIALCIIYALTEAYALNINTRAYSIYTFVVIYNAIYGFT
ncbi:unnamed protein product [Fusarium fujikuroi]|uniref:Uncharacterized protein n=1 Tax=Fusarium fujikuroi TaxID=5127 RepID=A0A9Q9S013_FUSFU|nr:unnamed protein product [Fusarium fujikuroi]VTT83904.1 unnamed protein product [Fusarium fujikuroi]